MTQTAGTKTVLIAEDSRFFRTMLAYALDEEGYRSLTAGSGAEALEVLARELPGVHLLLLDMVMPGLNGFELLEKLRQTKGGETLPVIVISQYGLNPLEKEILGTRGVHAVLAKSVSVERILYEVREALFPEEHERRRTSRSPVSLPVTIRAGLTTYVTTTFNLSEEGMFVTLADAEPPKVGADVTLKFWVPDATRLFQVPARVAWVNNAGPDLLRTHPAGFGVQYVSIENDAREAIRGYLRTFV